MSSRNNFQLHNRSGSKTSFNQRISHIGTGTIYCFGDGQFGQLGINIRQESPYLSTPCNIPIPAKVVQVDCGIAHTAAVTGEIKL